MRMEGLKRRDNLWKELERHEVMGDEGLVKVIESLVKDVVETIYGGVRTHHAKVGEKRVIVCDEGWWRLIWIYIVGRLRKKR